MSSREIKLAIIEQAEKMADIISKGNDIEITKTGNGIKIVEEKKKVVR